MATRKPLVFGADGIPQQLQPGDTLNTHAKFTGTTSTAFAINLGQTQTMTVTVTPAVSGDNLLAGEDVNVQPSGGLPNGVNIAYAYVSDANKVVIAFTSSGLISVAQTVNWRVTAFR